MGDVPSSPEGASGPETRHLSAGGVRVRVLEQGRGEPVLFLHGVGGWAENWRPVQAEAARRGYRAIACDLPGFGLSQAPTGARYLDPERPYYAAFVRELAQALGLSRLTLAGHSLGGAIAAVTALCFPELVERLVLVAPGGFGATVSPRLRLCGLPLAQLASPYLPEAVVRHFVRASFKDPSRVPGWMYEEALRYCGPEARAEMGRVLGQLVTWRGPRPELHRAWAERAREIRCPTLVVWGRDDATVPFTPDSPLLGGPAVELRLIEDAGHMPMLEQPEAFEGALFDFLGRSAPAPA